MVKTKSEIVSDSISYMELYRQFQLPLLNVKRCAYAFQNLKEAGLIHHFWLAEAEPY
jgi:hypothetical protein